MANADYFKIENHPYIEHHTYTGPGCAICGKGPDGHKPDSPKPDSK